MRSTSSLLLFGILSLLLSACTNRTASMDSQPMVLAQPTPPQRVVTEDYSQRVPSYVDTHGEKAIVVFPSVHAWGAYGSDGHLVRAGLATAGANYCPDIKRPCRTKVGSFRINSLGKASCKSSIYPLPRGGAPMPYCMFFNGHQGLHGSYNVVDANASHGCVRMKVVDAEWVRFNFARVGTKVIVKSY